MDTLTLVASRGHHFCIHTGEGWTSGARWCPIPFPNIDLLTVLTYGISDQAQVSILSCSLGVSGVEKKRGYGMK